MAWSWSHTAAAYDAARANLEALPPATLEAIAQEWTESRRAALPADACAECRFYDGPCQECRRARVDGPAVPADPETLWDLMADAATCDNGGWDAWACPTGCHTVPFSPPSETGPGTPYARCGRGA